MSNSLDYKNAVAAIRVSTTKQGTDGDSPEAQREQIERFAENKGIVIKKYFVFLESASKEQQPMQEAVNYCKDPKNKIELFIIKSIDRFTRGGSLSYDLLKTQLDVCKVNLVDIYGVIRSEKVNTLDHLGFEYKWSVFSPSKKSEILEAERSKDELRDIMSRMIGAEIRYTRMGYWMRRPPYGYISEKIDTQNGKRMVLKPHPEESRFIIRMFELRASGKYTDREIADKLNDLGYATRTKYMHSKIDPGKVMRQAGGNPLNDKHLWRIVRNPIYAGVNVEKWTDHKPVQCMFDGLVSIELFNKANKGKRTISKDANNQVVLYDKRAPEHLVNKGKRNPDFAYRKVIMCPQCNKSLLGSASRGKSGMHYPAYHCNKRGHYFRVSKQDLEDRVAEFVSGIQIAPDKLDSLCEAIEASWEHANVEYRAQLQVFDARVDELRQQASVTVEKIKVLSSTTAIKYMEEDLMKIEKQIETITAQKEELENKKPVEIKTILARARYFVEHLEELLLKQIDPIKKAQFFGAIFDKAPTYEDIKYGTQKTPLFTGVNSLFEASRMDKTHLVNQPDVSWNQLLSELRELRQIFTAPKEYQYA
jgi:site-specific DNA recombinase